MEKVEEFEFVDEDPSSKYEIITIYMDQDDMGRTFVTEPVIRRFHLDRPMLKLTLDTDEEIYEIEQESVNYIIDNQNNNYAPYAVIYQLFNFKNEIQDELESHKKSSSNGMKEITIFRDVDNADRVFVTLDVVDRFHLDVCGDVVKLGEDSTIYEVNIIDAINIAANRNNKYAPYRINYIDIQFTPASAEAIMPYDDALSKFDKYDEEVIPYDESLSKFDKSTEEVMPYDDELSRFDRDDQDVIDPRPRRSEESVRDYKIYLEGYYDGAYAHLGKKQSYKEERYIPGTSFKTPRKKGNKESQEEYEEYLKVFYGRIFSAVEGINKLGSSIIKRRPQRDNESDAEYNKWLAEETGIPVVESPLYAD